jgi:hypothetical protein
MGLLLESESVLHPVLVISLRVVFTGVSPTGLLAVRGGNSGLGTDIISTLRFSPSPKIGKLTRK